MEETARRRGGPRSTMVPWADLRYICPPSSWMTVPRPIFKSRGHLFVVVIQIVAKKTTFLLNFFVFHLLSVKFPFFKKGSGSDQYPALVPTQHMNSSGRGSLLEASHFMDGSGPQPPLPYQPMGNSVNHPDSLPAKHLTNDYGRPRPDSLSAGFMYDNGNRHSRPLFQSNDPQPSASFPAQHADDSRAPALLSHQFMDGDDHRQALAHSEHIDNNAHPPTLEPALNTGGSGRNSALVPRTFLGVRGPARRGEGPVQPLNTS